jgi:Basic region leucine zipper
MASSLYQSSSSYPVEDAAGTYARGDRTPSDISSSISPPNGQIGNNKYSTIPPGERLARALGIEEQSRLAVEEDKRRRNTAASARFRVKKKQREQALERAVRDATDVKSSLEARVTQLEMENRWLKNLLTEKNENLLSRLAALQPSEVAAVAAGEKLDPSSSSSSLLPPLTSSSSTSLTPEHQHGGPKKSDSSSASSQKPIKPKPPTVGVGTDDAK